MNNTGTATIDHCVKNVILLTKLQKPYGQSLKEEFKDLHIHTYEKKRFWSYFKINFLQKETRLESGLLILITLVQVALAGGG